MIKVGNYLLADERKYRRVFDAHNGGFGPEPTDEQIVAYYDKMGGQIIDVKTGKVMPTGSFWDFKDQCPKKKADKVELTAEEKKAVKEKEAQDEEDAKAKAKSEKKLAKIAKKDK